MMRTFLFLLFVAVVVLLARWSLYTVDAAEYAYVTLLGRPIATLDGADPNEAGLHVGWPWPVQAVQRLDRRVQIFDLPAAELLTHDPEGKTIDKTLSVEAYVLWRIADRDGVDAFVRTMGTPEKAREVLWSRINSQLGAAIGQMRMSDLVSTEAGTEPGRTHVDDTLGKLRAALFDELHDQARKEYGIELVDIRLRRFSHPSEVRDSIFARIRSERKKKATEYEEEGKRLASNIESEAEAKKTEIVARARFEETTLKGKADAEALAIRNRAQSEDPEFYAFLKRMEKLQSILA
ncbi:MAG TPA: protease modulator HflC, partial [Gemmataceae bacterium]|nr:protease modulator HflC [Gemmataceae bacterium]